MALQFRDDNSQLLLRSRLIGLHYTRLIDILDEATSFRLTPFGLQARSLAGVGLELTLIANTTEPGDEKVLGPLITKLDGAFAVDGLRFIVFIKYADK